jgi:hypothetical protein
MEVRKLFLEGPGLVQLKNKVSLAMGFACLEQGRQFQ